MARKGLGKGLDSLIPNIFDENFDSNSAQSLEDMMNAEEESVEEVLDDIESKDTQSRDNEEETPVEDETSEKPVEKIEETEPENDNEKGSADLNEEKEIKEEVPIEKTEENPSKEDETSQNLSGDSSSEETVQTPQKIQVKQEHVDEVIEIVNKNPRITLWSSRSSAVFRYLRKTEPEFSISKEASVLIEEAVAKKYPEIWALFEDL